MGKKKQIASWKTGSVCIIDDSLGLNIIKINMFSVASREAVMRQIMSRERTPRDIWEGATIGVCADEEEPGPGVKAKIHSVGIMDRVNFQVWNEL